MSNEFNLQSFLDRLPTLPGVYRHLDKVGKVLYIGKARNLKKRVKSYFQGCLRNVRIAKMVEKIARTEVTLTGSEEEALLLENNLIKKFKPRYNILFRDDKSYPYLFIQNHLFPRISYYRGPTRKNGHYFGPFPSSNAVRETIQVLQKVFKIRNCEDTVFKNRSRPCLLHQIGRCSAPCVKKITPEEYADDVEKTISFLNGKTKSLMKDLEEKMLRAARELSFENAAILRNQITSLSKVLNKQTMENSDWEDTDIIVVAMSASKACINLATIRGGRHLGDKAFFPTHDLGETTDNLLEAFIAQHYSCFPIPEQVICSHRFSNINLFKVLAKQQGRKIPTLITKVDTIRKSWLIQAKKNAELSLHHVFPNLEKQRESTLALVRLLNLDVKEAEVDTLRIECFDISHSSGEATQASCIVYKNHNLQPSLYRRFNIGNITPGDDCAAMHQVLVRRFKKAIHDKATIPDLILLDGGRRQVETACRVFSKIGLDSCTILGIAKGKDRKLGLEKLIFADSRQPITLGSGSEVLMLIAKIRDEAHRFAITGMRSRQAKARNASSLEDIEGIGALRRQRLLLRFGGIPGIASATTKELLSVRGISQRLAMRIHSTLCKDS